MDKVESDSEEKANFRLGCRVNNDKDNDDKDESFSNPFMSVITTVRMMLSDFDQIEIEKNDKFQQLLFLLFVVLITVVLFNLLNALAISDTNNIIKDAELVNTKKRISILKSYGKTFAYFRLTFANIFPELSSIVVMPNFDRIVRTRKIIRTSSNIVITIHKTTLSQKMAKVFPTNWLFWRKQTEPMKMSSKSIERILECVRQKQDKKTMSHIYQHLEEIKNTQNCFKVFNDAN